jgi:hypothetical protein
MAVAVAATTTTLVFKAEIQICKYHHLSGILQVGSILIPAEVFQIDPENSSELSIAEPWRLDPGERDIPGLDGLQRRISSSVDGQDECHFIPTRYLARVVER